ncbi:hypothetical protein AB1Y20_001066 [Prymnesium parvum]|uniref:Uncharacterized protein n=1 Tax=Prymnesium parvum TaxID=97485 RepID=A0AB34K7P2_PRYPA
MALQTGSLSSEGVAIQLQRVLASRNLHAAVNLSRRFKGSDFLALVADERHHMPHCLGQQCVAYDDDLERVHEDVVMGFALDEKQYELLRAFKWEDLDPLNHLVLALSGEEGGTSIAEHDATKARLGVVDYTHWVDKLMSVRHIDACRTTNLPIMDTHDVVSMWEDELARPDSCFDEPVVPDHLAPGTRIRVYWTEEEEWFQGSVTSQRRDTNTHPPALLTRVAYDASPSYPAQCMWHHLADERFELCPPPTVEGGA